MGPGVGMFSAVLVGLAMGLGVLVGVVVMVAARRARRLDDHPTCRRCRFDLVGLGERFMACPECGSSLEGRDAIRVGNRRAHRPLVVLGAAIVLGSLLIGSGVIAVRVSGADINRVKPVWMLSREATGGAGGSGATATRALAELTRRMGAGELSDAAARRLIAAALSRQTDLGKAWDPGWGDFVDAAWSASVLTPDERAEFLLNGLEYTLASRALLAVGAAPGIRFDVSAKRLGANTAAEVEFELDELLVGGVDNTARVAGTFDCSGGGASASWSTPLIRIRSPLGAQTLGTRWRVTLVPGEPDVPAKERMITLARAVTVRAEGEPVVDLATDPRVRAMLEKALSVPLLRVYDENGPTTEIQIAYQPLTCNVIGETYLREPPPADVGEGWKAREWKLGTHHIRTASNAGTTGWTGAPLEGPEGFDLDVVDVVLKPSLWSATQDPDVERIWGEELVIRGVRVEWVKGDQ